jgi:DNA-binding IclR family transcriptional regulator
MIVDVVEGRRAVRVAGVQIGLRGNAHARASGKALLAFGPGARVEEYLGGELHPVTLHTIADKPALRDEFERIRGRGYAVDREVFLEGVCCIAAPCLDPDGTASTAITVTIPADRFDQVMDEALASLLRAAGSLSAGGTQPRFAVDG